MREGVGRLVPRPLDRLRSIKTKLGVLVAATVSAAAFLTWIGLHHHLGPTRTFPLAIVGALVLTQVLARGMTSPLREMTAAARAMARGDYSSRVRATSRDEVGQLAEAFNSMADDLASEDRLRREMVANVSHELRTPVAALRAQLENMVDGVVPADAATLGAALAQTERLGELVTYLLDLSRLEAGAVGLDLADLAVRDVVDDVVEEVAGATRAAGRDVHWRVQVTPADLRVRADAARLSQVLANLLHNAARHTPPGSEVTVRAGLGARRQEVVIDVVDQGDGVPDGRARAHLRPLPARQHQPVPGRRRAAPGSAWPSPAGRCPCTAAPSPSPTRRPARARRSGCGCPSAAPGRTGRADPRTVPRPADRAPRPTPDQGPSHL